MDGVDVLIRVGQGEFSLARVFGLDPKVLDLLTARALGLLQHGKLEDAGRLLSSLVAVDIDSPLLPLVLGGCRAGQGRFADAIAAYGNALLREGRRSDPALRVEALLGRAQARLRMEDLAGAAEDLRAAAPAAAGVQKLEIETWLARLGVTA
ncbi:MAG: tetratricopeptide repeat protein [Myxococcota bacterium]